MRIELHTAGKARTRWLETLIAELWFRFEVGY